MLLENISLGRTVEIFVDRDGYLYRLVSKVENTNPRRVCVSLIASNGRAFMFHPEDEIKLVCREGEQMWEWLGVRPGLAKLDGELVHYFEISNKGQSFNRRNAYRVVIDKEVEIGFFQVPDSAEKSALIPLVKEEYEVVSGELNQSPNTDEDYIADGMLSEGKVIVEKRVRLVPQKDIAPQKVKALVKNISESGTGVYSNFCFQENDSFFMEIPSTYGGLKVKATIVRVTKLLSSPGKYNYYYGCMYSEADKRLIRYIYDVQRKRIRSKREQKDFESSIREKRTSKNLEEE